MPNVDTKELVGHLGMGERGAGHWRRAARCCCLAASGRLRGALPSRVHEYDEYACGCLTWTKQRIAILLCLHCGWLYDLRGRGKITEGAEPQMKRFIVVLAVLVLCSSRAWAQPAAVTRMAQVPRDSRQTFATLKQYFSNPTSSMFRLVSADPRMGTIVARRDNIDSGTWTEWAYCKLSPMHLLDTLQDA